MPPRMSPKLARQLGHSRLAHRNSQTVRHRPPSLARRHPRPPGQVDIQTTSILFRFNLKITGDEHFSEFVLAVMEALLQPAELQKVGGTPPPVVRSTPQ